jgi:hypothetical protein
MSTLREALALQSLLEEVGDRIKDKPQGRSYLSPDGRAYVLAFGGDVAKDMDQFMKSVGRYLVKMQDRRVDKDAAREELQRAFEEWLSKQKLSQQEANR